MTALCRLFGWLQTWLDPSIWKFALQGTVVRVDGHVYEEPIYRIVADREYEDRRCARCGTVIEQGWRAR